MSSSSESEEEPERTNGPTVRSEFAGFGAPRPFGDDETPKKKYEQPSPEELQKVGPLSFIKMLRGDVGAFGAIPAWLLNSLQPYLFE